MFRRQHVGWAIVGLLVFCAGMTAPTARADILTGLTAQYTFDASNGNDSTANALHTSNVGSPSFVFDATRGGIVADMPGGTSNYLQAGANVLFPSGAAPRTVASWVRIDSYASDNSGIWHMGTNDTNLDFSLETFTTVGTVTFNGWNADFDFTIPSDPNGWHHIAVTYDGTTVSGYVDGQFRNSGDFSLNTTNNGLRLGGQRMNNSNNSFDGALDDVRIYSRALSATDVNELYSAVTIPEPSTFILAALGTVALAVGARRRRRLHT